MSDNGLWIAAAGTEEENTLTSAYPSLVNATTGEVTELWEGGNYSGYTANDVTDDGKTVVGSSPDGALPPGLPCCVAGHEARGHGRCLTCSCRRRPG